VNAVIADALFQCFAPPSMLTVFINFRLLCAALCLTVFVLFECLIMWTMNLTQMKCYY